ncbi:hypothetical protein U1Q18_006390 [Sarracenia purpurea var. burkii]
MRRCSVQRKEEGGWLLIGGDTNDPHGGEREACLPAVSGEEEDGFSREKPATESFTPELQAFFMLERRRRVKLVSVE